MTIIYVPRAGGSTLILTVGTPISVPPMLIQVSGRDGKVNAAGRGK